ncbi:hypothetical protein [Rhodococcus wratislaviensis]|uniref:Uncharacterized protein n=1 Tax=Rhodococcus wratislaviensis NBRC 100605 TaxID=1219028 RepID=X0QGI9_RHOWR|nr:hypothetical protein [Rhodococcus wratislaviensis]GAF50682.1 hypothetical protein RW1_095_03070 [Rhodococcus wratislaviensis NBRC 100605]
MARRRRRAARLDLVWYDHLPYLNSPDRWPVFAQGRLAKWFEFYADAMELDVRMGTEFTRGSYDDATGAPARCTHGTSSPPRE